jgi:amidophosphoribosyltransferase
MCGIIGVSGPKAAEECYLGLIMMQHRGQDSCGILSFDEDIHIERGEGLAQDYLRPRLKELPGNIALGHVRYPTKGSDIQREIQPFFSNFPYGVGLVHNGNIYNYSELKEELAAQRRILFSKSDSEALLNLLCHYLTQEDIFSSIAHVMQKVRGGYSCVLAIQEENAIVGFRDPYGIRPLVLGRRGNDYCIASESVALDVSDYELVGDIKPGEVVVVKEGNLERRVLEKRKPAHCFFEWVYFSRPDSIMEGKSVYEVRLLLGRTIQFTHEADVVMAVPDTARPAAQGFSERNGIVEREGMIKNRYIGRTFIMSSQHERENAVNLKLNVIKKEVSGKRIVLIDDSIVRGTTSKKIVALLRKHGAREVHFVSTCPPIKFPCVYGLDFPTSEELIAYRNDDIAESLGADSVTYQTIEGLVSAIGISDLCTACLTGEYPTGNDMTSFSGLRKKERQLLEV